MGGSCAWAFSACSDPGVTLDTWLTWPTETVGGLCNGECALSMSLRVVTHAPLQGINASLQGICSIPVVGREGLGGLW